MQTPTNFPSDGCSVPAMFRSVLSSKRYTSACRRHDFECRYSLYSWQSANWYLARNVWKLAPRYLKWQALLYFLGVTVAWRRCAWTSLAPFPKEWEPWVPRKD